MPHLKAYDKNGRILAIGYDIEGEQGAVIIPNLAPHTNYPQGEFYVAWEGEKYESEKVVVPEFTTHNSSYKEVTFYFKDHLLVNAKSAYDIAVDTGFTGTQEEWVSTIKGDKGDKLAFDDLSEDDKEELKGERGIQGTPGDTPNLLVVNDEYDVTVFQPIAPNEYNAMRYFRDTSNTDEFMKGYDNYVAFSGIAEVDKTYNENYNNVIEGSVINTEGNDNDYAIEIGTKIKHNFFGYSISFNAIREKRGGVWRATIDGEHVKDISTYGVSGELITELITDRLDNTDHTLTLEFIGQDPNNPVDTPRGWVRAYEASSRGLSTFVIVEKVEEYSRSKIIDVAYPTSNKEYAIAVRPKDSNVSTEFFPYHGVQTSFKGENYVRQLIVDGQEVDLTKKSEDIQFKEAKLIQKIEHKLPQDSSIRMECTFIVTFRDSKVYNDIRFNWVQPSQVTSGYVLQMPFDANYLSSVIVDDKEQVDNSLDYGTQSDFENDNATIYRGLSNDPKGKDYVYQCKVTERSLDVDRLWLQHRDERLQKLYPQYYNMTTRESGTIDIFRGYYEIVKIKDGNRVYRLD